MTTVKPIGELWEHILTSKSRLNACDRVGCVRAQRTDYIILAYACVFAPACVCRPLCVRLHFCTILCAFACAGFRTWECVLCLHTRQLQASLTDGSVFRYLTVITENWTLEYICFQNVQTLLGYISQATTVCLILKIFDLRWIWRSPEKSNIWARGTKRTAIINQNNAKFRQKTKELQHVTKV